MERCRYIEKGDGGKKAQGEGKDHKESEDYRRLWELLKEVLKKRNIEREILRKMIDDLEAGVTIQGKTFALALTYSMREFSLSPDFDYEMAELTPDSQKEIDDLPF